LILADEPASTDEMHAADAGYGQWVEFVMIASDDLAAEFMR
jgi:hypothetical protein